MATAEQKATAAKLQAALAGLNQMLIECDGKELFVEFDRLSMIGRRNQLFTITKIEIRETVLP